MTQEEATALRARADRFFSEKIDEYNRKLLEGRYGEMRNTNYIVVLSPEWAMHIYFLRFWEYEIIAIDNFNNMVKTNAE